MLGSVSIVAASRALGKLSGGLAVLALLLMINGSFLIVQVRSSIRHHGARSARPWPEIGFSSYQGYRYSREMDDFGGDRAEKEAPQRTYSMGAHHERLPTHSSASRHGSARLPLGPPSGLLPAP